MPEARTNGPSPSVHHHGMPLVTSMPSRMLPNNRLLEPSSEMSGRYRTRSLDGEQQHEAVQRVEDRRRSRQVEGQRDVGQRIEAEGRVGRDHGLARQEDGERGRAEQRSPIAGAR